MGRGRALTTKIKEAKGIAKAIGQGTAKADEGKPLEESLKEHLGRIIDRVDPIDAALYGGLYAIGYDIFKDARAAMLGPISLRLATSPNEIAAASGLIGLASLGVIGTLGLTNLVEAIKGGADFMGNPIAYNIHPMAPGYERCKDGYTLMLSPLDPNVYTCCQNWAVGLYEFTGWKKAPYPGGGSVG